MTINKVIENKTNMNSEETQPPASLSASTSSTDWEYIRVEVTRSQSTQLFMKVPKDWRPSGRAYDYKLMGMAAKETTENYDWDDYGWEDTIEVQSYKPVDAKEAESYSIFDVRPHLPNTKSPRA